MLRRGAVASVSALVSGLSVLGSSLGRGHWGAWFWGKKHYSVSLSTQVCKRILANLMLGGNPAMD